MSNVDYAHGGVGKGARGLESVDVDYALVFLIAGAPLTDQYYLMEAKDSITGAVYHWTYPVPLPARTVEPSVPVPSPDPLPVRPTTTAML